MAIPLPDARELSDDVLEALRLRALHGGELGFTETEVAEIVKGELKPGEELVTGSMTASKTSAPGMGAQRR